MRVTRLQAVLFDWDGTLVNTAEASYRCYEKLFGSYGIAFDRDAFRRTYSPNWHLTYSALGLAEERWAEADARWLEHYCEEEVVLIEGARDALLRVRRAGLRAGIVTSGDRVRVGRELDDLGVASLFEVVVCAEDIVLPQASSRKRCCSRWKDSAWERPRRVRRRQSRGRADGAGRGRHGRRDSGGFPNRDALAAARPDVLEGSLPARWTRCSGSAERRLLLQRCAGAVRR
jgi:hypothetical protein